MKLEPQIDKLYEELNEELNNFSEQERFHSVRTIVAKYKVNWRVANETLKRMQEDRLLESRPGVGNFSMVSRKPHSNRVVYVFPDFPSDAIREWGYQATCYVKTHPGWRLRKLALDSENFFLNHLDLNNYSAAIIHCNSAPLSRDEMLWIGSQKIPIVFLNSVMGNFSISSVRSNNQAGGMMAAQYLIARGHREILLIHAEPVTEVTRNFTESFLMYCKYQNATVQFLNCETQSGESACQHGYQSAKKLLSEQGCHFSACYVTSSAPVAGVMTALREYGLQIPDDVSIIAQGNIVDGAFLNPPLTIVGSDIKQEVAAAFQGLQDVLENRKEYFTEVLPLQLVERASVAQLIQPERSELHELA